MSGPTRISLVVGAVIAMVVGAVVLATLAGRDAPDPVESADTSGDSALIRPDSRILGERGSTDVTFVEFLDFECEACAGVYPIVEDLRAEYGDRVTFVVRYFPLPGHFNAERAARAVESAARQGELEAMYSKMYETQEEWGEGSEPLDDLFREFADEIGLDLARYDRDYASDEVAERVQKDVEDGISLEVASTPTFYIDGRLEQPQTGQDLADALDEALSD